MTIISNNRKSIKLSFSKEKINEIKGRHSISNYEVTLPKIVCSDKEDAEYIQGQVNIFVSELSHKLIK